MNVSKLKYVSVIYLVLGAAAAGLYRAVYAMAADERELIVRGSLPEIALWVVTALALGSAVYFACRIRVPRSGNPPILGCLVYAAGIYTLTMGRMQGPAPLVLLYRVMIYAALASLILAVLLRILGKPHHFLLDLCPCVLCVLHLVECYQMWSEVPVLLDYVFSVGAILCAVLFAYHKLATRAELPSKFAYVFSGLAGIFFCVTAAAGADFVLYFLSMAFWMVSVLFAAAPAAEE